MRLSLPRLKMPRLPGFGILVWLFAALKGWVMGSRQKDNDSLIMYDRTVLAHNGARGGRLYNGDVSVNARRAASGERSFPVCQT